MKHTKRRILVTLFILIISTFCSAAKPLANANKNGLYVHSIEQVLRLNNDELDLATALIIISETWSDIVPGNDYLRTLDEMSLEIRARINEKRLPLNYQTIETINAYLYDELGFASVKVADNPDDLFIHTVIDNRTGYCLSLSVLYLSIGERLGLPLYGVVVPGHFFVRYDDGKVRFNIETTSRGARADDNHYIQDFGVPENHSLYMKNLTKMQTLGCFFNNLGNVYSSTGDDDSAQKALERAVYINPSLSESRANLGNIYLKKERTDDAIHQYREAIRLNADDAKTHNNLANAYTKRRWLSEAVAEYRTAIDLDPNFIEARQNLGNVFLQRKDYYSAITAFKDALTVDPANPLNYILLANAYSADNDCANAKTAYNNALSISPDNPDAYLGLGICYEKLNSTQDAIISYQKALQLSPNMTAAIMNLANIYFTEKDFNSAIAYYQQAAGITPSDPIVFHNLAASYANAENFESAAENYRIAIKLDKTFADAHNGLAFCCYQLKDYAAALKYAQKAKTLGATIDPNLIKAIEFKLNQ